MQQQQVEEAAALLRDAVGMEPQVAVILGSGLAGLSDLLRDPVEVPTSRIPHYPPSTVEGHEGVFLAGSIEGVRVLLLKGRIHAYEGYSLDQVVLPVRLMALCGARTIVLTNAAGGLKEGFIPGDIMLIEDHLNLQHQSPLAGPNIDAWGRRFPDMTEVYDSTLRALAFEVADAQGLALKRGVYASCPGPQYETPAEIRMLKVLGADAVGMSTVPEAIAARHMGCSVLGFSLISNLAAGISPTPLNHEEVVEAGRRAEPVFVRFLGALLPRLVESSS